MEFGTIAIDPDLVSEVPKVMQVVAKEGRTMVVVTHEMGFACEVANHLIYLHRRLIEEVGNPAQVLVNPKSERLAQFLSGGLKEHRQWHTEAGVIFKLTNEKKKVIVREA